MMETETIHIRCPRCSAVLEVKMQEGIEDKNVTCPVCKRKRPFKEYQRVANPNADSGEHTQYEDELTKNEAKQNLVLGRLAVEGMEETAYRLQVGRNVVGRRASNSTADFQVPTGESRRMSRNHLVVEVKKVPGKGFVHCVSLYKDKVNETKVNDTQLEYGDCVVLKNGDLLRLPDATLVFEIPDDEKTDF